MELIFYFLKLKFKKCTHYCHYCLSVLYPTESPLIREKSVLRLIRFRGWGGEDDAMQREKVMMKWNDVWWHSQRVREPD